ncbi:transcriptional regulator, LytTR family [Lentibacillus persicus]|uniref:Transcriptional regulator, LytTR family n=1 Tax=Lentibacillus persicus TaxID=640948 RepID=A0A1I1X3W7_9BACI|nr:response regulator transcription factor [Lentibacillus persicus]SFE02086.1 transcriptional regulator, LytTR family [Lentibacillus persicus]
MVYFKFNHDIINNKDLPSFSLTIDDTVATSIYSDIDMQSELVTALRSDHRITIFDQQEGLYKRLTIEANLAFYHKWFNCQTPLPEIVVLFELQSVARTPLHKCSDSELRRVYFAKYYMSGVAPVVFREPIHGVDVRTVKTFQNMLQKLKEDGRPALVLVSNMEHAMLVSDSAYKLQASGLHTIEIDEDNEKNSDTGQSDVTMNANLFKIPAKVDDKMILFDPPEIDYIESQDGKAMLVINNETYAMDATLAEIEKKLEIYGFYRCHRSYIVNLQKVREIITWSKNTYSLKVDNKIQSTIPLSRTKIQDIQEKFSLK